MSRKDSADHRSLLLGSLLRMAHAAMVDEYVQWLASSAYKDIQPAHAAVIQPLWQNPNGVRLTTLAQTARITKQSMSALVEFLEQAGYVNRIEDPEDRRASLIRLTARGRGFARDARKFALEVEARIAANIGARRLEQLRSGLQLLVEATQ